MARHRKGASFSDLEVAVVRVRKQSGLRSGKWAPKFIRDDLLAKQIAKAHGFARTGANIRARILDLLDDVVATQETTGRFLWASDPPPVISFRPAKSDEDRRSIDEISIAELAGLIQSKSELLQEVDPPVAIARSLGVARLSQSARERIEEALRSLSD